MATISLEEARKRSAKTVSLAEARAQTSASQAVLKKERGLFESIVKRPAERLLFEPARRFGEVIGSAAINTFGTDQQKQRAAAHTQKDQTIKVPLLGDFLTRGVKPGKEGAKQIAGEALETGTYLFPYGKVATAAKAPLSAVLPARAASVGSKSIAGAAGGYAADVSADLERNRPVGESLKPGLSTLIGAALPVAGEATKGIARLFGKAGDKIMTSIIRPTKPDLEDGFSMETVKKYGLGGSLKQSFAKTDKLMDDLSGQLNTRLKSATEQVDLEDAFKATEHAVLKDKLSNFGANSAMGRALDTLKAEIGSVSEGGTAISIPNAQTIKRASGHFGAWLYGNADPDANARQKVYNAFYRQLKTQIEQKSPQGVREINKQLSELIPVMNALIRRIPVAERNNALSLTDVITLTGATLEPRTLALTIANLASKSGRVGNLMSRGGAAAEKALKGKTARTLGDVLRRATVGGASQVGAIEER